MLFDRIIDDNAIDLETLGLWSGDQAVVKDFITGRPINEVSSQAGNNSTPAFLYEVVACDQNGVDVDKIDYLQRDAKCCGLNCRTNFHRLPKVMRVGRARSRTFWQASWGGALPPG